MGKHKHNGHNNHNNNHNNHNNHNHQKGHQHHHKAQDDDGSSSQGGNNQIVVDFLAHYHIGMGAAQLAKANIGTDADDTFTGGNTRGNYFGLGGDDVMTGGSKSDNFIGGAGNDILTGGGGADAFVFGVGDGHDVITDFDLTNGIGADMVRIHSFDGAIMVNREEFLDNYASQVGDSVVFTLNANDSIEFQNTQLADFYANSGNICLWLEG